MPEWLFILIVVLMSLDIVAFIFARIVAAKAPDAATGHIYMIHIGRSGMRLYLEYWQYAIYETISLLAITVYALAFLYMIGKNIWYRYYRWPPMPKSSDD